MALIFSCCEIEKISTQFKSLRRFIFMKAEEIKNNKEMNSFLRLFCREPTDSEIEKSHFDVS